MSFDLQNVGATYQHAMNAIFHELIGQRMEAYIDDVVVKSLDLDQHLKELEQAFLCIKHHNLKMNPTKCVFGVPVENFLGFLVHQQGIKVDKNKAKVILEVSPPRIKKEL